MTSRGYAAVCALVAVAGAVWLSAQAQNRPGEIGPSRVWVENRAASEAVPVSVQNTAHVDVVGVPQVALAGGTSVGVRAQRQAWDYRSMTVPTGTDPATAITGLGGDSWEAVGETTAVDGRIQILLKRPRT